MVYTINKIDGTLLCPNVSNMSPFGNWKQARLMVLYYAQMSAICLYLEIENKLDIENVKYCLINLYFGQALQIALDITRYR